MELLRVVCGEENGLVSIDGDAIQPDPDASDERSDDKSRQSESAQLSLMPLYADLKINKKKKTIRSFLTFFRSFVFSLVIKRGQAVGVE